MFVLDFSDPRNPRLIARNDPEGATFWAAYPHDGSIYGSSFAPATFTGSDEENDAGGLWVFDLTGWGKGR